MYASSGYHTLHFIAISSIATRYSRLRDSHLLEHSVESNKTKKTYNDIVKYELHNAAKFTKSSFL